jgi:hypothetical protein
MMGWSRIVLLPDPVPDCGNPVFVSEQLFALANTRKLLFELPVNQL